MAKKRDRFPKKIAGVKVPKRIRRFAETNVGGDLIAGVLLYSAHKAINSDAMRQAVAKVREQAARADLALRDFMDHDDRRTTPRSSH